MGQSTPPSDLARKDNRVLIGKDYQARDEKEIIIQASALDYMKYVDRYTNATNFGIFRNFFIGQTWGKYCVRLYTDKECSKTSKEVKTKEDQNKKDKK